MSGRASKKRDHSRYYEILGVSKLASQDNLKKAYKIAVIKNHPDKGGDPEKLRAGSLFMVFLQFSLYDLSSFLGLTRLVVLSDPQKRKIYDQYGEDAIKEGMGDGGCMDDPFDIFFQSFFAGSPFDEGSSDGGKQIRGEDVIHPLKVSLEDLYIGITKKLLLSRNVVCSKCKGIQHGQKITFPGEADEAPDTITGDVVFVLQQKDHPRFKRMVCDLFYLIL
ncbi:hypothetical protein Dimus_009301 [Dionaea muscipula]